MVADFFAASVVRERAGSKNCATGFDPATAVQFPAACKISGTVGTAARMEYTATSFAEPLQRVFDNVLRPEQDVEVTHHRESAYLVQAVEYRRRVPDRIERRLYEPVLSAVAAWGRAGRRLATGSVHRYLGYGFYTVCGALLLLAVT